MAVYSVSEIWIYPVKSLGGIRVPSARVLEKGLEFDRRWMLVDERGQFFTQRTLPVLALFRLSATDQGFRIEYRGESVNLVPHEAQGEPFNASVWDDEVIVREVSTAASEWFSRNLGQPARLVEFEESSARQVDPDYARNGENVSLADGYPLLIIGEAALADLNRRLAQPVPMNRFRPNLVFRGGQPHDEDQWGEFRIGKNAFRGVKPCSRCVMTTIDQQTAEVGKEPLATLSTYRKRENKIYFGQNVLAVDHQIIYEGDEITF
jgi:uncharacterized protein YcbX